MKEALREYLQRNLTASRSRRDREGFLVAVGVVELRDVAYEAGRKTGFYFDGYDSTGVGLVKGKRSIKILRTPYSNTLCKIVVKPVSRG